MRNEWKKMEKVRWRWKRDREEKGNREKGEEEGRKDTVREREGSSLDGEWEGGKDGGLRRWKWLRSDGGRCEAAREV